MNNKNATKTETIRLRAEEYKVLHGLLQSANSKALGRKIVPSDILSIALALVNENHLKQLQRSSLRNKDLKSFYRTKYIEENGHITIDEFEGFVMSPEFSKFKKSHEKELETILVSAPKSNKKAL